MTDSALLACIHERVDSLKRTAPLVHNITNRVVEYESAAAIAAVGATQVTVRGREEAAELAGVCAALAVNPGTLTDEWMAAARCAIDVASGLGTPWVLDPVAVGLTRYRTEAARELLALGPTVVKANASEILALAAGSDARGRGADSLHTVGEARGVAAELARRHQCVVIVTGPEDCVTDGQRLATVANGSELMARMIGAGCVLTAVVASFLATGGAPFDAAVAAVAYYGVAGEEAATRAQGPGTLAPALLDALHNLDARTLEARLRVTESTVLAGSH